ncbi:MAG: hypothetical protein ABSE73_30480 [Planctomycetota bacterium]
MVYLGEEEVNAYLRHLIGCFLDPKTDTPKTDAPLVWCPIGVSGSILAQQLYKLDKQDRSGCLGDKVQVVRLDYDRDKAMVVFSDGKAQAAKAIKNQRVLVMDSSVHSGETLYHALQAVKRLAPADICSYALVLKAGASTVPNRFGAVTGDHDRALFLLKEMWNNAVMPFGCLRMLREDDVGRPYIRTKKNEYDKWSWEDHWYEMKLDRSVRVYVYENQGTIVAVLKFKLIEGGELFIDLVAANKDGEKGLGGHLVRWAETQGRMSRCTHVTACADKRIIGWWERQYYERDVSKRPIKAERTQYIWIKRKLLYNLPGGPTPA